MHRERAFDMDCNGRRAIAETQTPALLGSFGMKKVNSVVKTLFLAKGMAVFVPLSTVPFVFFSQ
jgi:hypothetical protein